MFPTQGGQGGAGGGFGGMGGMGPMDFGRSKSKFQEVPETGVTFSDVAGCDGAKLELVEVVDFLKNPDRCAGGHGEQRRPTAAGLHASVRFTAAL